MIPSMSSSRAMSVLSGVMGIDKVARSTLVDILKGSKRKTTDYLYANRSPNRSFKNYPDPSSSITFHSSRMVDCIWANKALAN